VQWEGQVGEPVPSPSASPTTTSAAPSPSPTVPSPTATSPTPSQSPTGAACTASAGTVITEGAGSSFADHDGSGECFVHNNNWNDSYGGSHVITACDYDNWFATVNIGNHADNGVDAYPNVHRDYNDVPLANIRSADFAGHGPNCAGCIYNVAFDIWIGSGLTHELMIWTENWGQRPAGNQVDTVTIGGHDYQAWRNSSGDGGITTYVSVPEQLSGRMPLSLFFADARARGWTPTPRGRSTLVWRPSTRTAPRSGSTSPASPSTTSAFRRDGRLLRLTGSGTRTATDATWPVDDGGPCEPQPTFSSVRSPDQRVWKTPS
jgi:hypothetical protein